MTTETNGTPTLNEIVRRLQRMEDRMDARILSLDVYTADKLTNNVSMVSIEHRLDTLEATQGTAIKLLIGSLFGMVGQAIYIIISLVGHGGAH